MDDFFQEAYKGAEPSQPEAKAQPQSAESWGTQFFKNFAGGVAGLGEMVGSIPGLVGAVTAAVTPESMGGAGTVEKYITHPSTLKQFPEDWRNLMESAGAGNLLPITQGNIAGGPIAPQIQQNEGYQAFGEALQPGKSIGKLVEAVGQNNNLPGLTKFGQDIQEWLDPVIQAGLLAHGAVKGETPAINVEDSVKGRNSSMEFYRQMAKQKVPQGFNAADAEWARATYPKGGEASVEAPKGPTAGIQGDLFPGAPTVPGPEQMPQSEQLKRGQEAAQGELTTMAEQQAFLERELSGQGDLFNQPRFGGEAPEWTTEGGKTPRTAEMPQPLSPSEPESGTFPLTDINQTRPIGDQVMRGAELGPMDYQRMSVDDVNNWLDAQDSWEKPGFLRTAEDLINVRFDRIRQMEEQNPEGMAKLNNESRTARPDAGDITGAIDPIPVPREVLDRAETGIAKNKNLGNAEYIATDMAWHLRGKNALDNPSDTFPNTEADVLANGIQKPVEITYSSVDGKAMITDGNTRTALAMKHGLAEVPARVKVTDKPLDNPNAVTVGTWDLPKGQAKPSDIGLDGRPAQEKLPLGQTKAGRGQRGSINIFGMKRTPRPEELLDKVRQYGSEDERPLQQVVDEAKIDRHNIGDMDSAMHLSLLKNLMGNLKTVGRNIMDARSIRALSEGTGFGPVVRWVNQQIEGIDRWQNNALAAALRGNKFTRGPIDKIIGRGFEHRLGSEDGIIPALHSVPVEESAEFVKTWIEHSGKTDDIPFRTEAQQRAYHNIRKVFDGMLDQANAERAKLGLDPVERMPGFMPFSRELGDYRVMVYDRNGELKRLYTFKSLRQAVNAQKAMQKNMPDLDVRNPVHKQTIGVQGSDLEALLETAKANRQNDELSQAIDKTVAQVIMKRGAGGHFMQRARQQIGGFLGEDGNIKQLSDGMVLYAENMTSYIANMKRRGVQGQLEDLTVPGKEPGAQAWRSSSTGGRYQQDISQGAKLMDVAPNLHNYLTQYIMKSRGALSALDQLDKAFFEEFGKGIGLGETALQRGIYKLNNFATVGFLMKMPFFASQFFQHTLIFPRIMQMSAEIGARNVVRSALEGYMYSIMPGLDKTGGARDVVNYAIKKGFIDPTLSHMLEGPSNYGYLSRKFYQFTGTIEREFVRIPALLMIENSLRESIPDKAQRYDVATQQMYRSMAGTTRSNSPLLYTKMGPVGSSVRALKSYATNFYGQFAEYFKQAQMEGDISHLKPLAGFLATTAMLGGVNGIVGVQEATAVITAFNYLTGSHVRTPQEWFLTGGNSDAAVKAGGLNLGPDLSGVYKKYPMLKELAVHGGASIIMGRDIQAQVGNPAATSLLSIVPAKLIVGDNSPVMALFHYVIAAAQGQLTDSIRMKTYEALTLNNPHARAFIEQYFQKPGQPVPRPYMNMGGTFYRDQPGKPQTQSYAQAELTGAPTMEERDADMLYRFFKQSEQNLSQNRANIQNSMVDDLLNGKFDQNKMKEYVQQGGDPKNWANDMKQTIIQRSMTGLMHEAIVGSKGKSTGYAWKMQQLQPYMNNDPFFQGAYSNPNLPHRADGGPVKAGQAYLVGEQGPELLKHSGEMVGMHGPEVITAPKDDTVVPNYELMRNRPEYATDQFAQNLLGPLAHEQMVRSDTAANPLRGLAEAVAAPAYEAWKYLDPVAARGFGMTDSNDVTRMSDPSWEAIGRAFHGFGQGLSDWLSRPSDGTWDESGFNPRAGRAWSDNAPPNFEDLLPGAPNSLADQMLRQARTMRVPGTADRMNTAQPFSAFYEPEKGWY